MVHRLLGPTIIGIFLSSTAAADVCVDCHKKTTPHVVKDWRLSRHSKKSVGCATCHGAQHRSAADVAKAQVASLDTCGRCHEKRVSQFKRGKHALGWVAMNTCPATHLQPVAMTEGMKGCGGCHGIGLKSHKEMENLKKMGFEPGNSSCDACHTRHLFSVKEARQPQACKTCHNGIDYAQWDTYSASKHGTRFLLQQDKILPADSAAPTCQTCHMQNGDHEVREAWGSIAVRPMAEDEQWAADRVAILQAFGVLDPEGKPTAALEALKQLDMSRPTPEAWMAEREQMLGACKQCHSERFARRDLAKGDQTIREMDHLAADAIRTVAALYRDGVLAKPESYGYPFPSIGTLDNAPTPIERKLKVMFVGHRKYALMGVFHGSPEHALTYGSGEMRADLTDIKAMAEELRRAHQGQKK